MSKEESKGNILNTLEWYPVESKSQFYDEVERRYFLNTTSEKLLLGFGHNTRRLEIIAIAFEKDAIKTEDPDLKALEGVIIEGDE